MTTPTAGSHERDGYYIYGLVDPQYLSETGGHRLLSIFYVGKGKKSRWMDHERDMLVALREEIRLERRGGKDERIRMILDKGHKVPAVRLSAGYVNENDAYYAESLAIDTIGAALAAAGRPPLCNATPGHHAGFVWLREHFVFTEVVEQNLEDSASTDWSGTPTTEILVKGTSADLVRPGQRLAPHDTLPDDVAVLRDRVLAIALLDDDHPDAATQRGWDPLDPWTDLEARERARRYWPIAARKVASWVQEPSTMPARLLLGIPEPGGRTVVRYAWDIDASGTWEYYPQIRRWGVPLDARVHEHPRLGATLYETRQGRRVQVLLGYAAGIRVIDA